MTEHRQDTTDTPQKCHQDTTTTETLFRDHRDTSTDTIRTNATNSRKACKGRLPKSCCQLPNEYMQVYCGRYMGATGDRLLKRHLQVDICRCRVADVKTQVGINFLKSTYNIFSKFLVGRQGSVDWCPRNATLTKRRSSCIEIKLQCGFVPCQPSPTKCVSIVKSCGWNCEVACLLNSFDQMRVCHRESC